ncbi:MAG: ferredoxin [Novosphingobium sp.]|jgi:ferredoxin
MQISVDGKNCCGHARCWVVAREFYNLDVDGYNIFRGQTVNVPPGLENVARLGAKACPDKVIRVIED